MSIASTESFTVDSATLNASGATLAVLGTLTLNGVQAALNVEAGNLQLGGVVSGGTINLSGGSLTMSANSTYGGIFVQTGGVVKLNTRTLTLSGVANFSQGSDIDGQGSLVTSGTTTVNDPGNSYYNALTLGAGAAWTNSGTANVGGEIGVGDAKGMTATITNSATGVFNLTSDDASIVNNTVNGVVASSTFNNQGVLAKTGGTGTSHIYSTINDTGTIAVASGALEIDAGGTFSGSLTGNGTLAFAGGTSKLAGVTSLTVQNVLINGGAVTLPTAVSAYGGVISLQFGSMTLGGNLKLTGVFNESAAYNNTNLNLGVYTLTLAGNSFLGNPGYYPSATIDGHGVLASTGVVTVADDGQYYKSLTVGGGMTWNNTGTVFVAGTIGVGDVAGLIATFTNSGTFNFTGDDGSIVNNNYNNVYGSSTFANSGLLEKTGGFGTSHIYANVTDTTKGAIKVAMGTLEFDGGGTFAGPITGNGVVNFAAGNVTLQTSSSVTVGHLVFGGATATLASNFISYAGTLEETGGSVTLGANLALSGYFEQTLGAVNLNGKTLTLSGTAQFGYGPQFSYNNPAGGIVDGSGSLLTSGSVRILGAGLYYKAYNYQELGLGGGVTWKNTGTVSDAGLIGVGDASGPTANINNAAGANFNLTSDDAGIVNNSYSVNGVNQAGNSTFTNAGTLTKTGGAGTSHIWSVMTDTGAIGVQTGTLEFDGGGAFSGAFTGAGVLAFGGGQSTLKATTLTVSTLVLDGGNLTLTAPSASYAGTIKNYSGMLTLGGNLTDSGRFYDTNGYVALSGYTLTLKGAVTFGNPPGVYGNAGIDGAGALLTQGTVKIYDPIFGGSQGGYTELLLGGGMTWTNNGVVNDGGVIAVGDSTGASANIVNAAGATFNFTSDDGSITNNTFGQPNGQNGLGYSTFTNVGTIVKTDGFNVNQVWSSMVDTGTIAVQTGTLEFDGGGSFTGAINGAGTIAFGGAGASVTLNSGKLFTIAGLLIDGASVTLPSDLATYSGTFTETSGQATLSAGLILTGPFAESGGDLWLNGSNLTLNGAAAFAGASIDGPGTLTTSGATTITSLGLGGNANWTNTGVVTDSGGIYIGDSYGLQSSIINSSAGTFNLISGGAGIFNGGGGGGQLGSSTFTNQGLLEMTGGDGGTIASSMVDTGTISVQIGTLDFTGGGSFNGAISGAGTVEFDSNTAVLGAGAALSVGGLLLTSGELEISTNLAYGGVLNQTGGDLNIDASDTLTLSNYAYLSGGTVDGAGTIEVSGQLTLAGVSLANSAETIDVHGLITGYGQIGPAVTNNGLIEATGGSLVLGGPITGTGALQVDPNAEIELQGSTAQTVNFNGPGGALWLDTQTSFTGSLGNLGAGDLIALGSTNATGAAFASGGITVTLSGGVQEQFKVLGSTSNLTLTLSHDTSGNSFLNIGHT